MDRIALISDIHGNLPALEATLADIRGRAIECIFCLGDLVGKGPHSAVAVDICQALCERVIRGNWDDGIAAQSDNVSLQWHAERLGPARVHYLQTLPNTIELLLSGKRVRLFHASQQGVYHRVHKRDAADIHLAMFNNTEFTGDTPVPDIVGYADIHDAFLLHPPLKTLFNVGSVGNPLDVPLASYVILEGLLDSPTLGSFALQFIRVAYDIEKAIQQAKSENMPHFDAYAHELRTAEYVRRQRL